MDIHPLILNVAGEYLTLEEMAALNIPISRRILKERLPIEYPTLQGMIESGFDIPRSVLKSFLKVPLDTIDRHKCMTEDQVDTVAADMLLYGIPDAYITDWTLYPPLPPYLKAMIYRDLINVYSPEMIRDLFRAKQCYLLMGNYEYLAPEPQYDVLTAVMNFRPDADAFFDLVPIGLMKARQPKLVRRLMRRGFKLRDIDLIAGLNSNDIPTVAFTMDAFRVDTMSQREKDDLWRQIRPLYESPEVEKYIREHLGQPPNPMIYAYKPWH